MPSLSQLEQRIFEVEGLRVSLTGPVNGHPDYGDAPCEGSQRLTAFKQRFHARYPGVDIVVFDGLGRRARGSCLVGNVRASYDLERIDKQTGCYKEYVHCLNDALRIARASIFNEAAPPDPYAVLGVAPGCPDQEWERAYARLSARLRASRIDQPGLDPAFVEFAWERAQLVDWAREQIAAQRQLALAA